MSTSVSRRSTLVFSPRLTMVFEGWQFPMKPSLVVNIYVIVFSFTFYRTLISLPRRYDHCHSIKFEFTECMYIILNRKELVPRTPKKALLLIKIMKYEIALFLFFRGQSKLCIYRPNIHRY